MIFRETELEGVYIIEPEKKYDERGFFARAWCAEEFEAKGLVSRFVQCNISYNKVKGTVRGMHYQCKPYEETKLVRCTRGVIFDVVIDLRPESPTYCKWLALQLSGRNYKMLYIPGGFAHGFQTLEDDTEVFYQMSEFYHPECSRGIRWNDPFFKIVWPEEIKLISEKDSSYPDFNRGGDTNV